MKPVDIYKWKPIEVTSDGIEYKLTTFIYEICMDDYTCKTDRIQLRYYIDHNYDGTRGHNMFSVWFDDKPIMICRSAGRSNRDAKEFFITDKDGYLEMIAHIISTGRNEEDDGIEIIDPNDEIGDDFYSTAVADFYNPEGVNPKYKVGDIVLAMADESHAYNSDKIETRVEITQVKEHSPHYTYSGSQLDRVYRCKSNKIETVKAGKGGQGWRGCDKDINGLA